MLEAYTDGLRPLLGAGGYDVVHSQDCLSANAALALRDEGVDRPRDPHRPPRRRLHVAVARRVPGPLDHRARPPAVRLGAVGGAAAPRVRRRRRARAQRRRRAPLPAAARRRRARRGPGAPPASATAWPCSPSAASSRARARSRCSTASRGCARALPERDPLLVIAGGSTLFDYRHELERFDVRARELGVTEHVRVLGPQEPEAIERLFRGRGRVRVPVGQGGLRAGGARGARGRAPARRLRHRRVPRLPGRRRERAARARRGRRGARRGARAGRARPRAGATGCGAAAAPSSGASRGRRRPPSTSASTSAVGSMAR